MTSKKTSDAKAQCALCLEQKALQLSHIVPKFVFDYLKRSAPSSMRSHRTPNLRIQDGQKKRLLCRNCEQLLSGWEKRFSENLFMPLHDPQPVTAPIRYEGWALKFAVSVSWRVLEHYAREGLSSLSPEQNEQAKKALEVWRGFLIGKKKNPARFQQHLLPLDVIEEHTAGHVSPFLNRYLLRTVHTDVIASKSWTVVYTKLCRILIFGFISVDDPSGWKGMKLHVRSGVIEPTDYMIPAGIMKYINDKADEVKNALNSLSPKQDQIVSKSIQENLDRIANSESFRAMSYDIAHSGKAAFKPSKTKNSR